MLESICKTPHEVDIAFAILFATLIAVSIGKGGGKLLLDLLKKLIGHGSVNNKESIKAVSEDLKDSRDKLWGKLDGIEEKVNLIQVAVGKLVVERNYQMEERRIKKLDRD